MSNGRAILTPAWSAPAGVQALTTTRVAGDMAQADSLPPGLPAAPRWLKQVHGIAVADLDAEEGAGERVADASFTTRSNVVCVVRTADCLPVLLAATDGRVVGAAHAGWRGLAAGVIEATVAAMRARCGGDVPLQAWLGPAIGPQHFEVGEEVREAFLAADPGAGPAFTSGREQRWLCNLYLLARQRLAHLGIREVAGGGHCTYAEEARFFSHRRDVQHRGQGATGRMASCIWRT